MIARKAMRAERIGAARLIEARRAKLSVPNGWKFSAQVFSVEFCMYGLKTTCWYSVKKAFMLATVTVEPLHVYQEDQSNLRAWWHV